MWIITRYFTEWEDWGSTHWALTTCQTLWKHFAYNPDHNFWNRHHFYHHSMEKEIERVICPKSYHWWVVELGYKPTCVGRRSPLTGEPIWLGSLESWKQSQFSSCKVKHLYLGLNQLDPFPVCDIWLHQAPVLYELLHLSHLPETRNELIFDSFFVPA
jgi:hypothetical protein